MSKSIVTIASCAKMRKSTNKTSENRKTARQNQSAMPSPQAPPMGYLLYRRCGFGGLLFLYGDPQRRACFSSEKRMGGAVRRVSHLCPCHRKSLETTGFHGFSFAFSRTAHGLFCRISMRKNGHHFPIRRQLFVTIPSAISSK